MPELDLIAELETRCPECGQWVLHLLDDTCEDCDDRWHAAQEATR